MSVKSAVGNVAWVGAMAFRRKWKRTRIIKMCTFSCHFPFKCFFFFVISMFTYVKLQERVVEE